MSNPYKLNEQQALILKALSEGLTLQYGCSGDWTDSVNSVSELLMIAAGPRRSNLMYRIKPKTVEVSIQDYSVIAAGREFLYTWRSDQLSRSSVEARVYFHRWVGVQQTIELWQAQ